MAEQSKPSLRVPESEAFREWFSGSKVVDSDGSPLAVFHGSAKPFDKSAIGNNGSYDTENTSITASANKAAAPLHPEARKQPYYHGTSSEAAARAIMTQGIQPREISMPAKANDRSHLAPAKGRVYFTPDFLYASFYALGSNSWGTDFYERYNIGPEKDKNPYGYIFEIDGEDISGDVLPDEDFIGQLLTTVLAYDKAKLRQLVLNNGTPEKYEGEKASVERTIGYNSHEINRPQNARAKDELRELGKKCMTDKQREKVSDGMISGQAMVGKKIQKLMSPALTKWMLDHGAHGAHEGVIFPSKVYRFRKADASKINKDQVMSICSEIPLKHAKVAGGFKVVEIDSLPKDTQQDLFYMLSELTFSKQHGWDEEAIGAEVGGIVDGPRVQVGFMSTEQLYQGFNRKPSEAGMTKYVGMLAREGFEFDPILVNNGQFLDGGHRLEAYHRAERARIPVCEVGNLYNAPEQAWEEWMSGEGEAGQLFPLRKVADWGAAEDLRKGDTLASPGPVILKVKRIYREGDELVVMGDKGAIRRFSPEDEVNWLRKSAGVNPVTETPAFKNLVRQLQGG